MTMCPQIYILFMLSIPFIYVLNLLPYFKNTY